MYLFMTGLFHSRLYLWGSCVSLYGGLILLITLAVNILLYEYINDFIHSLMDLGVVYIGYIINGDCVNILVYFFWLIFIYVGNVPTE